MTNANPGPCSFLGNLEHVPAGPSGEDLEQWDLKTSAGIIRLKPGQILKVGETWTPLRKIRRCANGEVYGMAEYPDGGLLWTQLVPAPVPELTDWQKAEVERLERTIPRQFWVLGDMSRKIGDRLQGGTVVFMASTRPFTAGIVVAKDDGSLDITDDVMALLDGRTMLAHTSTKM